MQDRLSRLRSVLLSTAVASLIHLPVLGFDGLLRSLAGKWHKPPLLLIGITVILSSIVIFSILQSGPGVKLYENWLQLKRRHEYRQEDQKHFEKVVTSCIKKSPFMFCMLATGQTIHTGPERFIACALEYLPKTDGVVPKKIRVLLLRRESGPWKERVRHFQQQDASFVPQDYQRFSEKTESLFHRVSAWVEFYDHAPTWRMFVFEDRVFVSHYYEPLHREIISVFYRDRPGPYRWFYSEFLCQSPEHWTNEEAAIKYAAAVSLGRHHNDIARRAHDIYELRRRRCESGSPNTGWSQAEQQVRDDLKKDLIDNLLPSDPPPLPPPPPHIH